MAKHKVSETVARPVRTAVQMAPAGVLTEFTDAFIHDLSNQQYGALFGLLTLLFGWGQVLWENYSGRALLRSVPPTAQPVVDDAGDDLL